MHKKQEFQTYPTCSNTLGWEWLSLQDSHEPLTTYNGHSFLCHTASLFALTDEPHSMIPKARPRVTRC